MTRAFDPRDLELFEKYKPLLGDRWEAFCRSLATPLPYTMWGNPIKLGEHPEALGPWLERCGLEATPLEWLPGAWRLGPTTRDLGTLFPYHAGLAHIQEEVSLIPPRLLAPRPGERVLDTCAAPGGKTAQLATMMRNRGTVVANDRAYQRMRALRAIVDRLGIVNVTMTCSDAANFPKDLGLFDKILVDVPCSCEGTTRKNPSVFKAIRRANLDALSNQQTAILRRALQHLVPGGELVYSTCSFAPQENEAPLHQALEDFGWDKVEMLPIAISPTFKADRGLASWQGQSYHDEVGKAVRVWPQQNDTGGFFLAHLRRR